MHNLIKKYTLTGLILLGTALNSPSQKTHHISNINRHNNTQILTQSNNSKIQTKSGAGTEYYNLSRQDVEKSLDELCRNKNTIVEDAWMYTNNKLTDIGYDEDTLSVGITELLVDLAIYNAKPKDTIILYHIHPNSFLENRFSSPSITDIINHAAIKPKCTNKGVYLIEKMFDGRGMWEFDADDELIQKINNNITSKIGQDPEIESVVDRNENPWNPIDSTKKILYELSKYNSNSYNPLFINPYIFNMNKVGVKLQFTPRELIGKE